MYSECHLPNRIYPFKAIETALVLCAAYAQNMRQKPTVSFRFYQITPASFNRLQITLVGPKKSYHKLITRNRRLLIFLPCLSLGETKSNVFVLKLLKQFRLEVLVSA